jgi:legumain
VYPGSAAINYQGETVTAANFEGLISGLPTTADDYVFIYYDNHGDTDILGVPDGCGDYIYADDLAKALSSAASGQHWKKALFGIEACYAGSTAEEFPTGVGLATITASNDHESSYAAVYDSQIGTYLSNEFTNYFLAELTTNPTETVGDLFNIVAKETQESHATYYGDDDIKALSITNFVGTPTGALLRLSVPKGVKTASPKDATAETTRFLLTSRKPEVRVRAKLHALEAQYLSSRLDIVLDEVLQAVDIKHYDQMKQFKSGLKTPVSYWKVIRHFVKKFGKINPDDAGKLVVIKNLCRTHTAREIIAAIDAIL